MKTSIRTNSLALVGAIALVLVGSPAKATLTYTPGDLFLGFRDSSGTASQDYLVDIGQASQFNLSSSFTVVSGLSSDLATAFGSDWATNGNIHWSIYGTTYDGTTSPSPVLYATNQEPTVGTQSDAWLGRPVSAQKTTANAFNSATSYYISNGTATANEPTGTFQTASSTGSYNSFFQYPSGKDFNVWTTIEGDFTNGTSGSVLDLYRIDPVNGATSSYEGSFSLSSSGTLSYTISPVPEPSVVGLLCVVAMIMPVLLRNRRRSAASRIPSDN